MERVRRFLESDYQAPARILEINPRHTLIQTLARLVDDPSAATVVDLTVEQLYEDLLLLEGLHPDPAQMVPRVQSLLERTLGALADAGERA